MTPLDEFISRANRDDTPQAPSSVPTSLPEITTPQETLDEIDESFQNIVSRLVADPNPELQSFGRRLSVLDFGLIEGQSREDFERTLDLIKGILESNPSERTIELLVHISVIEGISQRIQSQRDQIAQDTRNATDALIPNEFLRQSDSIFSDHISDKLLEAEGWDIQRIILEATSIHIESNNIGSEEWDDFFHDLQDEIPENKMQEFLAAVEAFKSQNSELYDGVTLDTHLGVDIESIGADLDETLQLINSLPEGEIVPVNIGSLEIQFTDKHSAAMYIYKIKLIFSELTNNCSSLLADAFGLWWGGNTNIVNTGLGVHDALPEVDYVGFAGTLGVFLLTTAALIAFNASTLGGPIESVTRNVKDIISIKFGNNQYSKFFGAIERGSRNLQNFLATSRLTTSRMPILGSANPLRLLQLTKPLTQLVGVLTGGSRLVFEAGERAYLEAGARDMNYTLVDGLMGENQSELGSREEAIRRVRVLEFYRNKWHFDPEKLEKFDKLASGVIYSNTETFWLRVWEIDRGEIVRTIRGEDSRDNLRRRGTALFHHTRRVFWFPNKEEEVMKQYNENVRNSIKLLGVIFKDVSLPSSGERISIGNEKTPFFRNIESFIDLNPAISREEEAARKVLMSELITGIKQGKVLGTVDELKRQIAFIANGYEPTFKTLGVLGERLRSSTISDEQKGRLLKFSEMVESGKWTGTPLESERAISQILSNTFDFRESIVDISVSELKKLEDNGRELESSRFNSNLDSLTNFRSYFEGEIGINTIFNSDDPDSINRVDSEISKLYTDMVGKEVGGEKIQIAYTKGQINYILRKIFEGQSYEEAAKDLSRLTPIIDFEKLYGKTTLLKLDAEKLRVKVLSMNFEDKVKFFDNMFKDNPKLKNILIKFEEFKNILSDFDTELKKNILGFKPGLNDLKLRLENEIENLRVLGLDSKDPLLFDKLAEKRRLEAEINRINDDISRMQRNSTTVEDRVDFYRDMPDKILDLQESIDKLSDSISRIPRTDIIPPRTPETDTPPRTPETDTPPRTPETDTPPRTPETTRESAEIRNGSAKNFADRVFLQLGLSGIDISEEVQAEVYKAIRDADSISQNTTTIDIIKNILSTHNIDPNSIPSQVSDIRSFADLATDIRSRALASDIGAETRIRITDGVRNGISLRGLLDDMTPARFLKYFI